jgi:large subunit ribosomal protein L25
MATIIELSAEPRDRAGKGPSRAFRRAGRVPAVVYGDRKDPVTITVDPKELATALNKPGFFNHLIDLKLPGGPERVLARDVQLHPVTDRALHVDFMRVGADSKITVMVPVQFVNHDKSPGLKRGGMLNVVRHEVELLCPATEIPEKLVANLDGLNIGDTVHISMIPLPEGVRPTITDRDFTVATLVPPTVEAKAADAAPAA